MRREHVRSLAAAVLLAAFLVDAGPAAALSVSAPTRAIDRADVTVRMASADATGAVTIYRDGVRVRSAYLGRGASLRLPAVWLAPGTHRFTALLEPRKGRPSQAAATTVAYGWPSRPSMVTPVPGSAAGAKVEIKARAGVNTTLLELLLNGRHVRTLAVGAGQTVSFGTVWLAQGRNTVTIKGSNAVAASAVAYSVLRTDWPWPTCIVIDKSERRLYWVQGGMLVKTYPVAIGKASTPTPARTWKVLQKYATDPNGIYGPRKMRLYKQVATSSGYTYEFTRYNIHGTNEPWVIGTMASHGCIRMYNRDVLDLYPRVPIGTMVLTRE